MRLKLKFGAIRGVVRGVVILGVGLGKNKTPDLMSCGWVIILLLFQQITSLIQVLLNVIFSEK